MCIIISLSVVFFNVINIFSSVYSFANNVCFLSLFILQCRHSCTNPQQMCPILRDSDLRVRKETHNVFSCLISWRRGVVGYSFTLFQALATAAGYDPVRGPGSSCLVPGASGKCVLPWGNDTKSVSSIVLVAYGVSFAVCRFVQSILVVQLPFFS